MSRQREIADFAGWAEGLLALELLISTQAAAAAAREALRSMIDDLRLQPSGGRPMSVLADEYTKRSQFIAEVGPHTGAAALLDDLENRVDSEQVIRVVESLIEQPDDVVVGLVTLLHMFALADVDLRDRAEEGAD